MIDCVKAIRFLIRAIPAPTIPTALSLLISPMMERIASIISPQSPVQGKEDALISLLDSIACALKLTNFTSTGEHPSLLILKTHLNALQTLQKMWSHIESGRVIHSIYRIFRSVLKATKTQSRPLIPSLIQTTTQCIQVRPFPSCFHLLSLIVEIFGGEKSWEGSFFDLLQNITNYLLPLFSSNFDQHGDIIEAYFSLFTTTIRISPALLIGASNSTSMIENSFKMAIKSLSLNELAPLRAALLYLDVLLFGERSDPSRRGFLLNHGVAELIKGVFRSLIHHPHFSLIHLQSAILRKLGKIFMLMHVCFSLFFGF